jgi:hypothetical protein
LYSTEAQCPFDKKPRPSSQKESTIQWNQKSSTCPETTIRVLVLTSPAAENLDPNISQTVNLAFGQLTTSTANSLVDPRDISFNLIGNHISTSFIETGNLEQDVDALPGLFENLRVAQGADLVVMLTDDAYSNHGIVMEIGPDRDAAYAIAEVNNAVASKTFAHEVGHLLGGQHNSVQNSFNHTGPFGYLLPGTGGIGNAPNATIMGIPKNFWNNDPDYSRTILYFSTPDRSYNGTPVGVAGEHDVAFQMETVGETVANFVPNGATPFAAYVSGPWSVCNCESVTLTASTLCPDGTVTYSWAYSRDGVNFTPGSGGGPSFNLYSRCSDSNSSYVVRLTASDGHTTSVSTKNVSRRAQGTCGSGGGGCPWCFSKQNQPEIRLTLLLRPVLAHSPIPQVAARR